MKVLVTALLSVALHLLVGWEWTVLAGVVVGVWSSSSLRAGAIGAGGAALGWAVFVIYTAAAAPASFRILLDTMGRLAGNIPGEAMVGMTVLLGGVLGALGAGIGGALRPLLTEASVFIE
jgi:hypothetical protein